MKNVKHWLCTTQLRIAPCPCQLTQESGQTPTMHGDKCNKREAMLILTCILWYNREQLAHMIIEKMMKSPKCCIAIQLQGPVLYVIRYQSIPKPPPEDRSDLCVICQDKLADIQLHPCKHTTFCTKCAAYFLTKRRSDTPGCPLCRTNIQLLVTEPYPLNVICDWKYVLQARHCL